MSITEAIVLCVIFVAWVVLLIAAIWRLTEFGRPSERKTEPSRSGDWFYETRPRRRGAARTEDEEQES